jgi:hypothetical protein
MSFFGEVDSSNRIVSFYQAWLMITAAWDIQGIPQSDMSGSWCVCKASVQCVFESGWKPGVHYFEFSGFNEFFEIWMVFCVVRTEKRSFRVDIAT